ncbi:alpha/beta hydrolase [Bizionia sp.]|uniref:alpha/beta hydrolase n=1 Tax=Bizionia sp. TaxID=1954480 RepID=UPI003A937C75
MKGIFNIYIIVLIAVSMLSCNSKKETSSPETASKFYTDSIFSSQLAENRKHNVYLPTGFNRETKYPIIYATDGSNTIENSFYKLLLDSLIDNQIMKPVILIASHSNSKIADSTSSATGDGKKVYLQYRNFEYVNRQPTRPEDSLLVNRFRNHIIYFKDELISHVENEFNQKIDKTDRYFYGVSNGAGFGLSLLHAYPDKIGTYICLSTFGGNIQNNLWKSNVAYPDLYLQYGSDEPWFLKEEADFLKSTYAELNLHAEIKEFNGGHDYNKWQEAFTETIITLFKI